MLNRDLPEPPVAGRRGGAETTTTSGLARSAAIADRYPRGRAGVARGLTDIQSIIELLPEPILLTDEADRIQLTNPSADALFADHPVGSRDDLLSRFEALPDGSNRSPDIDTLGRGPAPRRKDEPVVFRLRHEPARRFSIESFPLERHDLMRTAAGGQGSVYVLREGATAPDDRPDADAFLAIMSHELRTPITTIYAGSSVLAHGARLSPPASQTLALDISAEAARLYDLVEDLIVIARLERNALDPLDEPVLLQRIADVTARVVASRAPDVVFIRDGATDPPPARGDATYVEQAARDLALAASRFGGPDRPVTLQVDHAEGSAEVTFRVLDTGPALGPHERNHAFDLPTDPPGGRVAGSGVGPYVARHLVEAMGGRVWARNRIEGGIERGFALPVDQG